MRLLALDTATERMALALADGEVSLARNADGGAAASMHLLPEALALLASRDLRPADLDAVAFGCGPGAFTGLRTAVAAAQGLAFGIGCPVLPIDSLLIVADDARQQAGRPAGAPFVCWVAMDARMDEVYAGAYRHDGTGWSTLSPPALYDLPTLAGVWADAPAQDIAGSALQAFGDRLATGGARCWPQALDRAAALLRLARAGWQSGAGVPAEQAMPLYLRDKVAQTTAERAIAKAAVMSGLAKDEPVEGTLPGAAVGAGSVSALPDRAISRLDR